MAEPETNTKLVVCLPEVLNRLPTPVILGEKSANSSKGKLVGPSQDLISHASSASGASACLRASPRMASIQHPGPEPGRVSPGLWAKNLPHSHRTIYRLVAISWAKHHDIPPNAAVLQLKASTSQTQ